MTTPVDHLPPLVTIFISQRVMQHMCIGHGHCKLKTCCSSTQPTSTCLTSAPKACIADRRRFRHNSIGRYLPVGLHLCTSQIPTFWLLDVNDWTYFSSSSLIDLIHENGPISGKTFDQRTNISCIALFRRFSESRFVPSYVLKNISTSEINPM